MKREKEKRNFRVWLIVIVAINIIWLTIILIAVSNMSNDISDNGGLGQTIGNFIGDIKSGINEEE